MNKLLESTVPAAAWWSHIYVSAGYDVGVDVAAYSKGREAALWGI